MSPVFDIPRYPGYGASCDGRIWTRKVLGGQGRLQNEWRELSQMNVRGYKHVAVRRDDGRLESAVHRLVAITFIGDIPAEMQINHKDGDKTNNRIDNLEIVSPRENMVHALTNGLRVPSNGESHYLCKLSNSDIKTIKALYLSGDYTQRELGEAFGVVQPYIGRLIRGERRGGSI